MFICLHCFLFFLPPFFFGGGGLCFVLLFLFLFCFVVVVLFLGFFFLGGGGVGRIFVLFCFVLNSLKMLFEVCSPDSFNPDFKTH